MTTIKPADDTLQQIKDALQNNNMREAKRLYREEMIENYRLAFNTTKNYSETKKIARELIKEHSVTPMTN